MYPAAALRTEKMMLLDRDKSLSQAVIRFSGDELRMLNNTLNEVCNGVDISDAEFQTRIGWDRTTLRSPLDSINGLLTVS